MSTQPPAPYMATTNPPQPAKVTPKGSRIPDVVIVKNVNLPPTQDNIQQIYEIKFPPDDWTEGQKADYGLIAGDAPVDKIGPDDCGCGSPPKEQVPVPVPAPAPQKQESPTPRLNPGLAFGAVLTALGVVATWLMKLAQSLPPVPP